MSYPKHSKTEFFKYTSASTAINILETATVRYSSPLLFNDPFDIQSGLHFDFDILAFPDTVLNRIRQLVESEQAPELVLHEPMGQIISLMREKKTTHGTPEQVLQGILLPFLSSLRDDLINLQIEYQNGWRNFLPRLRVFSVSEEKDNLLLWAHYGESHTGVAFEFLVLPQEDNPLCVAEPVIYSQDPPSLHTQEEWVNETLGIHELDHDKLYFRYAYVKSDVWAYEKEWRVWDLKSEPDDRLFSNYPLIPKEVGSVYLGCKIKPEHKSSIISLISQKYPWVNVYQAKKADTKFKLEFQQL
mgnify:FL=1